MLKDSKSIGILKVIRLKHREDLDIKKYNACIKNAYNSKLYAFSWYLDVVADHWSVLMLDDYKAVMPIPWNKKMGLRYSLQPLFCQQLGLFSSVSLDQTTISLFFKRLARFSLFCDININKSYLKQDLNYDKKINYTLNLNHRHDHLVNNYRKDRRKSLRKALKGGLIVKESQDKESLIALYKEVFDFLNLSDKYYIVIDKLIAYCLKNNYGFIREVYHNSLLVCSGFFINYNNTLYYMFSASSVHGKKFGATTFLIDSVIKDFSEKEYVFDFEGSSIKNIASFYKSFGSEKDYYYHYSSNVINYFFS